MDFYEILFGVRMDLSHLTMICLRSIISMVKIKVSDMNYHLVRHIFVHSF